MTVLRGEAHLLETNRPFGPIAQALDLRSKSADPRRAAIGRLLRGATDHAGGGPGTVDVRYRVIEEVLDLLEGSYAESPAVMLVEDLHWADESSLLCFSSMVQRLAHIPLLLAGTLRPAPRSAQLAGLLDGYLNSGGTLLRLGSLTPEDVDTLVQAELGLPAGPVLTSILRKASGNPLLVVELLRSLAAEGWLRRSPTSVEAAADELPSSLRELVLRRLQYLPRSALELLQIASVLGDAAPARHLAAMTRRQVPEVVADLLEPYRARLLDKHADAVVFRHQLVQEAIYQDLPRATRQALHRDAASVLVGIHADFSEVASHLLLGADRGDREAVRWLRQAAAEAAGGAPSVSVDLLQAAMALLPQGSGDVDIVAAELAEALQNAGRVAEASAVAESVLARPHLAEVDVRIRLALISALSLQNRGTELIENAETALASPELRLADRALVLVQASYGRTFSGDFRGGEATARRALEVGEGSGDVAITVWALNAVSVPVKAQGRYGEALALTRRAVHLTFDPVDPEARLRHPHFFLAMALCDADLMDESRLAYARAIEESQRLASTWLLPDMLLLAAEHRFLVGEWDDAATEFEAGLDLAERHGQRISVAQTRAYQAVMAAAKGDLDEARAALAGVEGELAAAEPCYGAELVAFAAAAVAEARGRPAEAYTLLLQCWQRDEDRDVRYYQRFLAPPLTRLGITLGHDDVASEVVASVEEGATLAPDVCSIQSVAVRCRGLLNQDPEALLRAVELARGARFLEHAGACEDAAAVLAAAGRVDEARDCLLRVQLMYESVGATAWQARVSAALRRVGVHEGARGPRRRPGSGWDSLTPGERAVARLVSEGLTNREAGQRLYISPHTVNTHLRHIFRKLSVSTRAELASKVAHAYRSTNKLTHSSDVSGALEAKTHR
jgi:DNA-binding CsgD family transcriptional regulator